MGQMCVAQSCQLAEFNYYRNMTLKDWINIAQIVSVLIASLVAIFGIQAWRREFVGKRRIELAEEVLALFYQAKDVIGWIRFPFCFTTESSTRKSESVETPGQKEINDVAYVLSKRYDEHSELFSRIRSFRYRFMAQFGRNASVPFDELKSILDQLQSDLNSWVMASQRLHSPDMDPQEVEAQKKRIDVYAEAVWSARNDDRVSLLIEKSVKNVEQICRPQIDRKSKIKLLLVNFANRLKPTNLPT
jgi:hypothetical protein